MMKISVLIPTYNAGELLEQTLKSVVGQNYKNYEVIIADGGSTDHTLELAQQLVGDKLLVASRHDEGQLDGILKALAAATGDICYFLNADDIVLPGSFDHVVKILSQTPDVDFVFSDDFAFSSEKRELYVASTIRFLTRPEHEIFYRQLYSECVFFRRRIWDGTSDWANLDLRVYTDYELFLNLLYGKRGRWTDKRLGAFRIVNGQMSEIFRDRKRTEYADVKKRFFNRFENRNKPTAWRTVRIWPRFFLLNFLWPTLERSVRKVYRLVTADKRRRLQTSAFFEWIEGGSIVNGKNKQNDPSGYVKLQRILYR